MAGRVGVVIQGRDAAESLERIRIADEMGIPAAWMTVGGAAPDALTIFAAAATQTRSIVMGTSIVPTWPRHPIVAAQQAVTVETLAPGRVRLGVGPSHEPTMTSMYGVEWRTPLTHLREYLQILRALLWEGAVDFEGTHWTARARLASPVRVPILASALQERSFETCGELADGAISWQCPAHYLETVALPAMQRGAERAGRETPPLFAHVPVAITDDVDDLTEAVRRQLGNYGTIPFYRAMYEAAGADAALEGDAAGLLGTLVVHGDEDGVVARLRELLDKGFGELLVMPIVTKGDREGSLDRVYRAVARASAEAG